MRRLQYILVLVMLFSFSPFTAQNDKDAPKTFAGKGLKEAEKVASKTWKNVKDWLAKKRGRESVIKRHKKPEDYILTTNPMFDNRGSKNKIELYNGVEPKLGLVLMYPRITPSKGFFSFKTGYLNYRKYFNDITKNDIEYIKLIVPDSINSECNIKKFKIISKKNQNRHVSFILDHSGSMGDSRVNKLQTAVIEAIRDNFKKNNSIDYTYSIYKFDDKIKHLITSNDISKIENFLIPNTGLKGFGGLTAIKDVLKNSIDKLKEDNLSKSKVVFLLTDGQSNSDKTKLKTSDIVRDAIDNNINIVPIGFGKYVNEDFLRYLSYYSGGQYLKIYSSNEFKQVYKNLLDDFYTNYEIEFSPCMFSEEIEIELKLKNLDKPLISRTFFSTPPLEGYSIDLNVLFESGKDDINEIYFDELNQLFSLLNYRDDIEIIIEGHTDRVGSKKQNKRLSQLRAEKVKKYLVNKGIASKRISTKGFGSENPAYPYEENQTENYLNRRIEIKINKP